MRAPHYRRPRAALATSASSDRDPPRGRSASCGRRAGRLRESEACASSSSPRHRLVSVMLGRYRRIACFATRRASGGRGKSVVVNRSMALLLTFCSSTRPSLCRRAAPRIRAHPHHLLRWIVVTKPYPPRSATASMVAACRIAREHARATRDILGVRLLRSIAHAADREQARPRSCGLRIVAQPDRRLERADR